MTSIDSTLHMDSESGGSSRKVLRSTATASIAKNYVKNSPVREDIDNSGCKNDSKISKTASSVAKGTVEDNINNSNIIAGTSRSSSAVTTLPVEGKRKTNIVVIECSDKQNLSEFKKNTVNKVTQRKKVKLSDIEDHIYSDTQLTDSENMADIPNTNFKSNFIYSKVSGKEKYIGLKITNLNDLKKATPRLKLPAILSSPSIKKSSMVPDEVKQKMDKYCRTCAGLKVPLVDIYGEKGIQMRLSQQIQHLEDIDKHDSLSTQMCMDCICDMRMSYKFFMQIKKAEMKLKSISNSLNLKTNTTRIQIETKSIPSADSPNVDETNNYDDTEERDVGETNTSSTKNFSDGNESFEEFDPDNPHDSIEIEDFKEDPLSFTNESSEEPKKYAYKYDESLNAYIKFGTNNVIQINDDQINDDQINNYQTNDDHTNDPTNDDPTNDEHTNDEHTNDDHTDDDHTINKENDANKKDCVSPSSLNQSSKIPNILKRKLSSGNISDENNDKSNKNEIQKWNIDLKDIKIPKLDLQDPANIKTEENGVMYVTAKGSKPNEMLLIKVKKMDKTLDKKADKGVEKKKKDINSVHKIYPKFENNKIGNEIDEQIEQYKKKRVQVLGETANISESNSTVEPEPEIRLLGDISTGTEIYDQGDNIEIREVKVEEIDNNSEIKSPFSSQTLSNQDKLKQRWQDIKKRHDSIFRDLAEDCFDRLKSLLRQKDEYIQDFVNYLKQRRIVVSRLKDEDIITLYETKNNVVIERLSVQIEEPEEEIDPFEYKEIFTCDFCDSSFPDREMEFEHAKIHDVKLMHYCEDCKQEFITHKAKRAHNITCVKKLMCRYCDMILESKGKKRQHEQKHCDEKYGQLCDLCGEKFKHQGTLDQHVKTRHMQLEKIFKCPQCSKRFAFRTKLTFHLKSVHTTSRPYLCEDCGSDFKNPASLRHHRIRKHQTINNKKECKVCSKMVPVYSMSKHMHTHKSYSIECPHCDKMFKNTSTLKQHVRIHEDQRQYKCELCGVGFNRRDGLRLHLKVHEKTDSRGLKECSCQVCGEKFPNHSMLVIHRNRTHKDGRNYTCHICNRSMISTRSLEWHLANIHNETLPGVLRDETTVDVETKRVSCFHCDKTFKTEMILRTHIKNTHIQKEPVKCLDCDELFTSDVRLKHHMMVTHNRLEGTLTCPHCPKRFVNQLRLKTHMISHSDERPHSCDICGFMLKTKIQLIKHKQNRHSNERPLQCRYCTWRCKQVSALVCHERTHTNERPYSCSVCKQKFKYLGDKNKHERRHEIFGGTGFKRIVTGRNTGNKNVKKKEEDSTEQESEQEQEYTYDQDQYEEYQEPTEGEIEIEQFDPHIVKFEGSEIPAEGSEASFEQMYVEDTSQDTSDNKIVMGIEETTVYTEEVTADQIEPEIITNDIIDEHVLQPGTVVHLQQEDETGKIQVIPVMLSLPDLTDATSGVNLGTASIMYDN